MPRVLGLLGFALQMFVVLLGVLTALFFLMRLSGDPVLMMVGDNPTPGETEEIRRLLGLDKPLYEQYGIYLQQVARLDFGRSVHSESGAFDLVIARIPATLRLAAVAIVMAVAVGVPVGIYSAVRWGNWDGRAIMVFAAIGQATPNFWLGILLILLFAVVLGWLPGFGSDKPENLILPAFALATGYMARLARLVRSEMLEVLSQDYIRTAHAKGLNPRIVLVRHALRNTLIPVVTVIALDISILLGGSIVIESVFTYSGIGRLLVDAIAGRDYPVVQAVVFFVAIVVISVTMLAEASYKWLDPRMRTTE